MTKLDKYTKRAPTKSSLKITAINIETKQWQFIKDKNLNLSQIVRDVIERLMADSEKELL